MKNIFKILLLLVANCTFSQTIIPIENRKITIENPGVSYYYKDINNAFSKFVGNWKYQDSPTNPTKIVEITFYKVTKEPESGGFTDEIYALIKYTFNGIVIYNTVPKNIPAVMLRENNIRGGYFRSPQNLNKLNFLYREPGVGGDPGKLSIEFDNVGGVQKLYWIVSTVHPERYKMPREMILIKQ